MSMKHLLALALSFSLAFGPAIAYASPGTIIKGDVLDGFENLLVNPSFDRATVATGWTVGGATAGSADTTNFFDGKQSIQLTGSANGTWLSQDFTPLQQVNTVNMESSMWVKTSNTTFKVCPSLAGSAITSACVAVPGTNTWQKVTTNFIGPSSGTIGVQLLGTPGAAATVNVDAAYVGRARNLSQVSQAQLIGQVKITGCSAGWSTTSTSLTASLGTPTGCTYAVTPGTQCTAPSGGNTPAILCPSLQPGNYSLQYEGTLSEAYSSANATSSWQFWDGTNVANETSVGPNASTGLSANAPGLKQTIQYTSSQSNVNFAIRAATSNAGSSAAIYGTTANPGVISVWMYPSQSQQALRADQTPASWSGTSTITGSTASTTFPTDFGSVSGTVTQTASRNMTCSAAASLVGVTCTLPRLGNYLACYAGAASQTTANANVKTGLYDGSGNIVTGAQNSTVPTSGGVAPIGSCGIYPATASSTTFKLMGNVTAGTGSVFINSFSITELDAPMPAPYLVGSVTSSTQGQVRTDSATFIPASGSCTFTNAAGGSLIASASTTALGDCTLTFTAGEFSGTPVCTATVSNGANMGYIFSSNIPTISSTQVRVQTTSLQGGTTTVSGNGSSVQLICQGPR